MDTNIHSYYIQVLYLHLPNGPLIRPGTPPAPCAMDHGVRDKSYGPLATGQLQE